MGNNKTTKLSSHTDFGYCSRRSSMSTEKEKVNIASYYSKDIAAHLHGILSDNCSLTVVAARREKRSSLLNSSVAHRQTMKTLLLD